MQNRARGGVIYVDEAGLVGAKDMKKLFELADALGARVILQGDTRQHHSVSRGDAMRLLEEHGGLQCVEITQIRRQKHAPFREAVGILAKGDIGGGFDKLVSLGAVKEVKDSERYKLLATDYLDALGAAHENAKRSEVALVITPGHAEGRKASALIRAGMRERGKLGEERTHKHLTTLKLSEEERAHAYNYNKPPHGDLQKNAKGFTKGQRLYVRGVGGRREVILSRRKTGTAPSRFSRASSPSASTSTKSAI